MSLQKLSLDEFTSNPAKYLKQAVVDGTYFEIETEDGTAVIIDESEWNIMLDIMATCLIGDD